MKLELPPKVLAKQSEVSSFYNLPVKVKHPVTGLEWPRGFQEVKVPSFHDDTVLW